jgi:peptidoglycan-N-acetylglucosamine deacetylase
MIVSSAAPQTQDATRTKASIRLLQALDATRSSHDLECFILFRFGFETLRANSLATHTGRAMFSGLETGLYAGLGTLGGLGLVTGGYAYAAMWPDSQVFGKTLRAPRKPGELALTFDDGPNPAWTPQLLDLLAKHEVRATFFLVGSFAQAEPELVRRIAAAGHIIGNHSWSHPNLAFTKAEQVKQELERTSSVLEQIAGTKVRFFRPPFGGRRPFVLKTARRLGMVPVLWNAITTDWETPSADAIAKRLSQTIDGLDRRGWSANVVMHDGGHKGLGANRGPSVAAAEKLIEKYRGKRKFVTVDAWA